MASPAPSGQRKPALCLPHENQNGPPPLFTILSASPILRPVEGIFGNKGLWGWWARRGNASQGPANHPPGRARQRARPFSCARFRRRTRCRALETFRAHPQLSRRARIRSTRSSGPFIAGVLALASGDC